MLDPNRFRDSGQVLKPQKVSGQSGNVTDYNLDLFLRLKVSFPGYATMRIDSAANPVKESDDVWPFLAQCPTI
jgi:hypothetical protein